MRDLGSLAGTGCWRRGGAGLHALAFEPDLQQPIPQPVLHDIAAHEPAGGGRIGLQPLCFQHRPGAAELPLLGQRQRRQQGGRFAGRKTLLVALEKRQGALRLAHGHGPERRQQQQLGISGTGAHRLFGDAAYLRRTLGQRVAQPLRPRDPDRRHPRIRLPALGRCPAARLFPQPASGAPRLSHHALAHPRRVGRLLPSGILPEWSVTSRQAATIVIGGSKPIATVTPRRPGSSGVR